MPTRSRSTRAGNGHAAARTCDHRGGARRDSADESHLELVPGDPEQALGDPESVARAICLQQLTRRARSRSELAATLRKRGIPDPAAAAVLDRFVEVGLIDDVALAESMAGAQYRDRGLARRAVAAKLRTRGLEDEVVEAAVGGIDSEAEYDMARHLVSQRLRTLAGLPEQVQLRRLVGLLARKGYSPGLAYDVVRVVRAELGGPADQPIDDGIDA